MVTVGSGTAVTIQSEGDASGSLRDATTLTAEYRTPFAVHAHLEAQAALADVQPDRIRVWCSTQAQSSVQGAVAKALGVDEKLVEVIPTYVGGGFGRKVGDEVAIEAARLSQAAGVPVHVGWTRTEDMRYGYFRPPTHHQLAARLDADGKLAAIEHRQASGDVAFAFLPNFLAPIMGADFGAYRGALIRYAVPNKQTVAYRTELPIRTGWWRGLGLLANVFAVESFMDEAAHAAGADPLEFRLRHLDDAVPGQARLKAVLNAAAERGGWNTPAPEGRGRGIACCLDVDTAVAMVAEVSVDRAEGKIRVHHVAAAMDPGLVVNPDGARAQVEGQHHVGCWLGPDRGADVQGRPGGSRQLRPLSAADHERGPRRRRRPARSRRRPAARRRRTAHRTCRRRHRQRRLRRHRHPPAAAAHEPPRQSGAVGHKPAAARLCELRRPCALLGPTTCGAVCSSPTPPLRAAR